jgi:hypothetical protein
MRNACKWQMAGNADAALPYIASPSGYRRYCSPAARKTTSSQTPFECLPAAISRIRNSCKEHEMIASLRKLTRRSGTEEETSLEDSLAFENAYSTFRQRHPQWRAALFDEHFLRTRLENRKPEQIDSHELADEWAQQFPGNQESRHRNIHDLLPAAQDFLKLYNHSLCDY